MKKNIIILIGLITISIIALIVTTSILDTTPEGLKVVTSVEDITFEEKPNIYLFWGDGCSHCENLKEFINELPEDYKSKFTLNMFETWYNESNEEFMKELSTKMGEEATGVPYMIIGEETFSGYASVYDEDIKAAINNLDENSYDVYKEDTSYQTLTFEEMYKLDEQGIIIDVRTNAEYNEGHLKESVNIPLDEIESITKKYSDKDSLLYLYCQSGTRSKEAVNKLIDLGYTNIYDLGGINNQNLELVK